jgi:hypothetical protein
MTSWTPLASRRRLGLAGPMRQADVRTVRGGGGAMCPGCPDTSQNGGGGIRTLVRGKPPETVFETAAELRVALPDLSLGPGSAFPRPEGGRPGERQGERDSRSPQTRVDGRARTGASPRRHLSDGGRRFRANQGEVPTVRMLVLRESEASRIAAARRCLGCLSRAVWARCGGARIAETRCYRRRR